jgi:methionine-rich copper-binding protein CopC
MRTYPSSARHTRTASLLGVVALTALLTGALATTGSAARHIGLASSSPAKDSHLMKAPTEIRLTFTGPVDVSKASIELEAADKKLIGLDTLRAVADSARVAVARIVAPLPGGAYTVRWRATAADGAAGSGSFGFMYMAPKE